MVEPGSSEIEAALDTWLAPFLEVIGRKTRRRWAPLYLHGLLGPDTTAVHATHLTGDEIAALGASGTGVCACPSTEADLADGVGAFRWIRDT